ncbi:MAG: SIMPL domain-containing protein [Chloroflexota bacterium]
MLQKIQFALLVFILFAFANMLIRPQRIPTPPPEDIRFSMRKERNITVEGEGEVKMTPDTAIVVIEITVADKEVALALARHNEIKQSVLSALRENDVEEKDVEVDFIEIFPESESGSSVIFRYIVSTKIKVTVHDLSRLESLQIAITNAGATGILGPYFQVSDLKTYQQTARNLAIQAAREKATAIAGLLGQEIGEPLSVQQTSTDNGYSSDYGFPFISTASFYGYTSFWDLANTVAFGQITIKVSARVVFQLK